MTNKSQTNFFKVSETKFQFLMKEINSADSDFGKVDENLRNCGEKIKKTSCKTVW